MSPQELRHRSVKESSKEAGSQTASTVTAVEESGFSPLDLARLFLGLLLMSGALSYLMTSGESFTFLQKLPWWTSPSSIIQHQKRLVKLTLSELKEFDGTDSNKPIYVAVNRTIYDVSASPHVYGPHGSYNVLAGKDASRAFITGCMDTDLVPDLRGVEEMYVPLWLSKYPHPDELEALEPAAASNEADAAIAKLFDGQTGNSVISMVRKRVGSANVKILQKEAYAAAHEECRAVIDNWKKMFDGSGGKNYFEAGIVVGDDGKELRDEDLGREPELCRLARSKRPKMDKSFMRAQELLLGKKAGLDKKLDGNAEMVKGALPTQRLDI